MASRSFLKAASFSLVLTSVPLSAATLTASIDNDGILGSDGQYTSGVFLRWTADPAYGLSLELGQMMWTPNDIEQTTPQPNERPYAGLLYLEGRKYFQTGGSADKFSLLVGTVGPNAMTDFGQQLVHSIIGSPDPQGWDYQIDNQIVGQVAAESHRLIARNPLGELSAFGRAELGNYRSEVALGATYRLGLGLESSFGSTSLEPGNLVDERMLASSNNGLFFFTSLESRYRFNDITIEGDRPPENNTLDVANVQGSASAGIAWYGQQWGASLSASIHSKDYEQSPDSHYSFGNMSVFYRY